MPAMGYRQGVGARILITGASGLIGSDLSPALVRQGFEVVGLDLVDGRDVRAPLSLEDFDGVVHLAAVSRVAAAEADPDACWSTNVGGTQNVISAAQLAGQAPWVLFASSREVYGQPPELPVDEDAPLLPLNVYGRAKVRGEALISQAPLTTGIVRLSNVYGRTADHADRVVPAFARAAVLGAPLRVDGRANGFDFTHIDDVTRGLLSLIDRLHAGVSLPPIQLVTGRETSLAALAGLARDQGADRILDAPPRTYDVCRFCGRGGRAATLLGWRPKIAIEDGFRALVGDFRAEFGCAAPATDSRSDSDRGAGLGPV